MLSITAPFGQGIPAFKKKITHKLLRALEIWVCSENSGFQSQKGSICYFHVYSFKSLSANILVLVI